jgi:hypothetical protein
MTFQRLILSLIQKGIPSGMVNLTIPHIKSFLDGDEPIAFTMADGRIMRIYK